MQPRSGAPRSRHRLRKKSTTGVTAKKRRLPLVLRARLRLLKFAYPPTPACLRAIAAILAVFAQLFVLHSPAFALVVQPLGVGSQSLRNGALDGSLALWIA